MRKINKDLITDFGWRQCKFCNNVHPVEKGLSNRKNRPRIDPVTNICTDCEKIAKKVQNEKP